MGEFQEPWRLADPNGPYGNIYVEDGGYLTRLHGAAIGSADEPAYAARVVAAINLLRGIPTERLTAADPAAMMLLACLRGADQEAATYADEVIARANAPEGFVPRGELEAQLAEIKAVLPEVVAMEDDAGWAVVNKYAAGVVKAEKPGPVFGTVPMTAAALAMAVGAGDA